MRETIKDASCLHNDASRARAANPSQFDWLLSSSLSPSIYDGSRNTSALNCYYRVRLNETLELLACLIVSYRRGGIIGSSIA